MACQLNPRGSIKRRTAVQACRRLCAVNKSLVLYVLLLVVAAAVSLWYTDFVFGAAADAQALPEKATDSSQARETKMADMKQIEIKRVWELAKSGQPGT